MKKRADILAFETGLAPSRTAAVSLIKAGRIKSGGKTITKSSELIEESELLIILGDEIPYVGRGGLKLEKALTEFKINPLNLIVLDVGSSTGGFTECLLRQGAKKIFAVDVGTGQLNQKIKNDSRVVSLEQTDVRDLSNLPEKPDLAVIDVSFISLEKVLVYVKNLISVEARIIALVKPQFETEIKEKNKSGVVRTEEFRQKSLEKIKKFAENIGLQVAGQIDSPILGGSGNKEYFILLQAGKK